MRGDLAADPLELALVQKPAGGESGHDQPKRLEA
jgi:hypothetical protein